MPNIGGPQNWTSPEGLASTLQVMLLLTVISLAPAILLMTTSFVRIIVVLGLLRQALGTQQLPPSQVITSIALFMTLLLMSPVWKQSYDEGIQPYTEQPDRPGRGVQSRRRTDPPLHGRIRSSDRKTTMTCTCSCDTCRARVRRRDGKEPDYVYYDPQEGETVVPLVALLPAFMLSELKTAFLIGFQIYLPFVIIDIVVASVTISMGMLMLPPVLISLPFKLLLFVLVDGWHLVVANAAGKFSRVDVTSSAGTRAPAASSRFAHEPPRRRRPGPRSARDRDARSPRRCWWPAWSSAWSIGLLQALTQIQEQTVAFVPKLMAMVRGRWACRCRGC